MNIQYKKEDLQIIGSRVLIKEYTSHGSFNWVEIASFNHRKTLFPNPEQAAKDFVDMLCK